MAEAITRKVIVSGNSVELYEYDSNNPVFKGYKRKNKSYRILSDEERHLNQVRSRQRSKKTLRRIINANFDIWKAFMTLTFDNNSTLFSVTHDTTNLKECNYQFKKFIERLKYRYGKNIRYVAVVEFQSNGNVHYHVIFDRYIDIYELQNDIWKMGICRANKINNIDHIGAYVVKYMQKDLMDNRLNGNKVYFTSKGLKKPLEMDNPSKEEIKRLVENKELVFHAELTNEYTAGGQYYQFKKTDVES